MKIIGIAGKKGHGKDSVYNAIKSIVGEQKVAKVAFADALKEEVAAFLAGRGVMSARHFYVDNFGSDMANKLMATLNENFMYASNERSLQGQIDYLIGRFNDEQAKVQFRLLLQLWGTEYRREQADDYWLRAWAARVAKLDREVEVVCVPDCRFPNEYEFLVSKKAVMVRVERPGMEMDATSQHTSETALDGADWKWDYTVVNDSTLAVLEAQVDLICRWEIPDYTLTNAQVQTMLEAPVSEILKVIVGPHGKMPTYAEPGAAGADLYAAESVVIAPGQIVKVRLDIKTEIPTGMYGLVRPRSGLACKHGILLASSGVMDSSYRGEWFVPLINQGADPFQIMREDRIAQVVFSYYEQLEMVPVDELAESLRGEGGFGSTGLREAA